MAASGVYIGLLLSAFIAANLPWLNARFLLVFSISKNAWLRWLEWLLWYALTGLLAFTLEYNTTGDWHSQQWEFYVATLCLFVVFALPGFIYHYDLKKLLQAK